MITKPSFFKNEIYIPHAKAGITDDVTDIEVKLIDFINRYERDCLHKCLGKLSLELFSNMDSNQPSLIKTSSDDKWDWLMNGHEYTKSNGDEVTWNGLRKSVVALGEPKGEPNYSFIAEYIYFFHESSANEIRANVGNVKPKSANSYDSRFNRKAVLAWRRFVRAVQGDGFFKESWFKTGAFGGYAVDYRGFETDYDVSLYQFINDMNSLDSDTYKLFNPKNWGMINEMTM